MSGIPFAPRSEISEAAVSDVARQLIDRRSRRGRPPETLDQYAGIIREMIRHEDDVLDQRITWLCQIQGLLFAALAFVWKEPTAYYLILVLCIVGLVVAITTWSALGPIWRGVSDLQKWWKGFSVNYPGPTVYARRGRTGWLKHFTPWNIIPLSFSVAWIAVIIIRVWN